MPELNNHTLLVLIIAMAFSAACFILALVGIAKALSGKGGSSPNDPDGLYRPKNKMDTSNPPSDTGTG